MLFNIEQDTGDCVVGYCVPDGFEATPRLRVFSGGAEVARLEANELRQIAGRRRPSPDRPVRILDHRGRSSGPRRPRRSDDLRRGERRSDLSAAAAMNSCNAKWCGWKPISFRSGGSTTPSKPRFQHFIRGAETHGRETVTQLLLLNDVGSSYLSGRILYKNYAYFIDNGFDVCMFIQDPHTEFAERLLILSKIRKTGLSMLGPRDAILYEPAIAFAESLPFDSDRALNRALRSMPGEIAQRLANPLARQMTASTPDEMPPGGAIASALDAFASFAAIGLRDEPEAALESLSALADVEAERICRRIAKSRAAETLGRNLADARVVDSLIETDRELYHHLSEAARRAAASVRQAADGA